MSDSETCGVITWSRDILSDLPSTAVWTMRCLLVIRFIVTSQSLFEIHTCWFRINWCKFGGHAIFLPATRIVHRQGDANNNTRACAANCNDLETSVESDCDGSCMTPFKFQKRLQWIFQSRTPYATPLGQQEKHGSTANRGPWAELGDRAARNGPETLGATCAKV